MKALHKTIFLLLVCSLISNCSNDALPSGSSTNFITPNDKIATVSISSSNITPSCFKVDTIKTKGTLMFGSYNDPATNNTLSLTGYARFSYTFSNVANIKSIVSSELRLYSAYSASSPTNISFDIYRVASNTAIGNISAGSSLQLLEKINTSPLILSTDDTARFKSYTLPDSYSQALFSAIQKGTPYTSGDSSEIAIALVPNGTTSIAKINTLISKLAVTLDETTETGTERKTVLMSFSNFAYTSSQTKSDFSSDLSTGIYISSSLVNKATLKFTLPDLPTDTHILHAELLLSSDTLVSKSLTRSADETYIAYFATSGDNAPKVSNSPILPAYSYQDTTSYGTIKRGTFHFDVTGSVQKWITKPSQNFGLQIVPSEQINYFSLTKFYYLSAPKDELLPTLVIHYTKVN